MGEDVEVPISAEYDLPVRGGYFTILVTLRGPGTVTRSPQAAALEVDFSPIYLPKDFRGQVALRFRVDDPSRLDFGTDDIGGEGKIIKAGTVVAFLH